ncbi:MAG: aminoacyl-tRNA hydrolase [Candidatus Paceibacterota bacterium]
MSYIIAGLGNPGEEYLNTRHNVGRIVLEVFRKSQELPDWEFDKKLKALVSKGKGSNVKGQLSLVLPETFMNKSGETLKQLVKSKKAALGLAVIHDDLDIPLGKYKISFNKSSGGHRGVESIIRTIKTQEFVRIRVGISPATPSGKIKKPQGEKAVGDFIISEFKKPELETIKKIAKRIAEALECLANEGKDKAMSQFN